MALLRRGAAQPAKTGRLRLNRPRAVTASAISQGVIDRRSEAQSRGLTRLARGWNFTALGYYDTLGECWYPAQFYSRSMERIRFFPAILNDQGEPEESEDQQLVDLFARIHDPGENGMRQIAKTYGQLRFLIGDGYLVASQEDDEEVWEYLSPAELRVDPTKAGADGPQKYRRLRAPGAKQEELAEADDNDFTPLTGDDVRVYRLWRKHPTYSEWSDSPVRAVLPLYELLSHLTLATSAEALSRAAQRGMFYVPNELTIESEDPDDVDEDPDSDRFMQRLGEIMTAAIQNPGSVEAMAPIILRGPGMLELPGVGAIAMKDAIGWFALGPTDRYVEGEMWEKTINRIALGLDMPSEMVDGTLGKTNHWSGWLLDEQGFRQHVAPVVEEFCGDIGSAYLRPAAMDEGITDADRVVVWYDPVEAIAHPDEFAVAKDMHERLVISDEALRTAGGATDEDAPPQDELDRRTLIALKKVPPEVDVAEGETAPQDGGTGADTTEQPPDQQQPGNANGNGQQPAAASAVRAAMILGAAEMQVRQARKVAGARLVRRSQACEPCRDTIKDIPHALVASQLGPDTVREIINGHTTEAELVAGQGAFLAAQLRDWGVDGEWPDELGRLVEAHALRTLYLPEVPPLPSGFATVVARALL